MEGPSLKIAAEQLQNFIGKTVLSVEGNTKIGKEQFLNKEVKDIFSWGKHLVFQFDTVAMRVHFLLFGTYEAVVDGVSVAGDYKRARESRLSFTFSNGEVKMFNCSIKVFETADLKSTYDFSIDILAPEWSDQKALKKVKTFPEEEIADVLLDQEVFAGVGNMIKNEVLSLAYLNPKTHVSALKDSEIKKLIATTKEFSHQFYLWKKDFVLRKNLKIHRKSTCPHCGQKVFREKTGKRNRWSYYCPTDQPLKK